MTIIESYEKSPFENIVSTLVLEPNKVIFLGDIPMMKKSEAVYQRVLNGKNIKTEIVFIGIRKNNLKNILKILTGIVESEEELVFDVTGGEDLVLLAFGMIYERYKDKKNIKLQRFNFNTGKMINYDNEVAFEGTFSLNVKEMISLSGGVVVPEELQPMGDHALEEVDKIWNLARRNGTRWNRSQSFLKEFERKADVSEDVLEVKLNVTKAREYIGDFNKKYQDVTKYLTEFKKTGLISDLQVTEDSIYYRYKSPFIKRCLTNAGDALEMKCYCEALALTERGKRYFDDCYVGVTIDWDGDIHSKEENWKDTTNEIDLILMRGLTPIFVSCKNGKIGEEELYKLNTVAEKFGGKHAKKMLIATKLEKENIVAKKAYMQRAKDMGIKLIPNAGELTKEEWKRVFVV